MAGCSESVLCPLNHVAKFLPVCPTYAFPQSGYVNLYNPDCECMSVIRCLCISSFCIMLLDLNAIFTLVFLNRLVMKVVSFPTHVIVAHFCDGICVCVVTVYFLVVSGAGFRVGGWTGKALLWRMFWMVVISLL